MGAAVGGSPSRPNPIIPKSCYFSVAPNNMRDLPEFGIFV